MQHTCNALVRHAGTWRSPTCTAGGARLAVYCTPSRRRQHQVHRRLAAAPSSSPDPAQSQEAMQKAMQDPKVRAQVDAMQEAMKRPEVQQQMQQMQAVMQNPQLMARMSQLKDDPELAPMFADIQKNGMAALMKYMNDPDWLGKVGSKLGQVEGAVPPAAVPPPAAAAAPEINTLLDAAKYGDQEAVEDFLAIGKDINQTDAERRTPLHYGVAYSQPAIVDTLLEGGADMEARDSKGNTPLHYAAGYGRVDLVRRLVAAGANAGAQNANGHTPLQLIEMEKRNPIHEDVETLDLLRQAAKARVFQDQ